MQIRPHSFFQDRLLLKTKTLLPRHHRVSRFSIKNPVPGKRWFVSSEFKRVSELGLGAAVKENAIKPINKTIKREWNIN